MTRKSIPEYIESDALRANLLETAEDVEIKPEYNLLLDIVANYRGIHNNLNALLYELCHSFRNWKILLPQLRSFVLKNSHIFNKHERGTEAFTLLSDIFFSALIETEKNELLAAQVVEALFVWIDKQVSLFDKENILRYEDVLNVLFQRIAKFDMEHPGLMMLIVQDRHSMKRVAMRLLELCGQPGDSFNFKPCGFLMAALLKKNYDYWLEEIDPVTWLLDDGEKYTQKYETGDDCFESSFGIALEQITKEEESVNPIALFKLISHGAMECYKEKLAAIDIEKSGDGGLISMLALPAHMDIVRIYKELPAHIPRAILSESAFIDQLADHGETSVKNYAENQTLLFLFRIMDTRGLQLIHEETLREINHRLVFLIRQQSFEDIETFLLTTFKLLKANVKKYPYTSLKCIQIIGEEIFKRGNSRMVETFLWEAVRFGFQHASVSGVDEDWQPITNPAHLTNIRVWLHLITQEPKWCATLFSALIINIKLAGTCVKDTDLFQRDITNLLNHPIEPVYNLVKQFAKLMPVFFNEIGAEGELRYVSTELDESHKRKDRLIHFLRKQSHVESSNLIVGFIQEIYQFWITGEKTSLQPYLPEEVFEEIETKGPFVDELQRLTRRIKLDHHFNSMDDILSWGKKEIKIFLNNQRDISAVERRRFDLLVQMYRLVHQKYNLSFQELKKELAQASKDGFSGMDELMEVLEIDKTEQCLEGLLTQLKFLKSIILSKETFKAKEAIHHKRHIAVDIPSMYGSYQEKKFDALSLTFRLENLATLYIEKLPETVNLSFITQATFFRIVRCLRLYLKALSIDGITSRRLDTYMSLLDSSLKVRRFSYTQYLDIFRGLSEGVKDVIYSYYTNIHQNNLSIIISRIGKDNLSPRYRTEWIKGDMPTTIHRLSESFFRDLISSTFGLQHLDLFIARIIQTLERQKNILDKDKLDLLMTYNPEKSISMLDDPNPYTHDLIHLSNKGFNLITLIQDGLPVPPAFIITTEVFRCREVIYGFSKARDEFMQRTRSALTRLEGMTDMVFGAPENPLLLSVRSGAALSMPGMMATIHNVGLNEDIIEEYVKIHDNSYLIWDNYRRFIQSWAMISGMDRDKFQALMDDAKDRYQVRLKWEFTPEQMQELALDYLKLVRLQGVGIPDDPWLQLAGAVEMVLDSWQTTKAADYRRIMDVSDSWGTAVIVQTMVYGNKSDKSGSGVLFTAHPYRKVQRVALWGDYAYGDQGEDIVSGLVTSYPISVEQAQLDGRNVTKTLEKRFPKIYERLLSISRNLVYEKRWNPQEIEFTFEGPEPEMLYLLQTRDMITIKKQEQFDVFIETQDLKNSFLGKGIGVSGSACSGLAVFSGDNIQDLRQKDPGVPLILIRQDTVPEDIKVIDLADGLLTSRGGQTSHASVVAVRLEKTCVVGCRQLKVYESRQYCEIGGRRISFGEPISIDGRNGLVLHGIHPTKNERHILPL